MPRCDHTQSEAAFKDLEVFCARVLSSNGLSFRWLYVMFETKVLLTCSPWEYSTPEAPFRCGSFLIFVFWTEFWSGSMVGRARAA